MTRLRCQVFREAWKVCLAPANSIYRDIIHNMNEWWRTRFGKTISRVSGYSFPFWLLFLLNNRVFCFSLFRVVIIIMVASSRVKRLLIWKEVKSREFHALCCGAFHIRYTHTDTDTDTHTTGYVIVLACIPIINSFHSRWIAFSPLNCRISV